MTQQQQQQQQQPQQQQQHRRQQQDKVVSDDDDDGCDESKCVSKSLSENFINSFTCYSNDNINDYGTWNYSPMMCADGYKPRSVESEPTVSDYQYFTCCPPELSAKINVSRHCSDPIIDAYVPYFGYINETIVCDDESRPYSRQMKTSFIFEEVESYMCCDSAENKTASFLDDTECVPYADAFYDRASVNVGNYYAYLSIIPYTCNFPDRGFQFPRHVANRKSSFSSYMFSDYECCNKTVPKHPFFQDGTFIMTVYPQIVVSAIAIPSCIIVIAGLSIPLLKQMRKQRTQTNSERADEHGEHTIQSDESDESDYSTYNLYLVYLAIPNLILNLYLLGMYGSYANQKYNPNFYGYIIRGYSDKGSDFEGALFFACLTANAYLNAVVSYEMLILLRNCHQETRSNPPSLLKVTLQAVAVYVFAILVFVVHYCIGRAVSVAYQQGNYDRSDYLDWINLIWSLVVTFILPIGYIIIWCRCFYMPSTPERVKELARFFFGIIVIFCVFWIPGMFLFLFGIAIKQNSFVNMGIFFCSIQPIVSMPRAMAKST